MFATYPPSPGPLRSLRVLLAPLAAIWLAACGSLPAYVDRPVSLALQPATDSPLVRIVQNSIPESSLTGFRLMPLGSYALDARMELARRARDSLDVQYYLIKGDRTGRLFMRSLRDAALRGVRVRLLVDDLYTAGSDPMFSGLAAFPNVEVRLFNPFCCARASIAGKYLASIADFGRLNHRMHNKLFIVDSTAVIMGGRNIADEYFTRSEANNFVDMDVLLVGAAVPQLARIFDDYWNSRQAYPVQAIVGRSESDAAARGDFDRLVDEGEQMTSVALPPNDILGYGPIGEDLDTGRLGLVWGPTTTFADQPAKVMATSREMARAMSVQMNVMDRIVEAQSDVVISSPYFVPGWTGVGQFSDLRRRGVNVTVLTNSLAATDEPLVHTGYVRYRSELVRAGVELYELSPTRIRGNERIRLPGLSLGSLHAKTAVIDQTMVFIGSMNLDPRSENTNTELGIVTRCPALAREVVRVIDISKRTASYQLRFGADGHSLQWLAREGENEAVFSSEPEATPFARLKSLLLMPFVPERLL